MMTTSISSNYLATALLPSIAQTQSTLTADGVEESTGRYANIGLQLGDQSGYELSLKNENELLQTLTTSNSVVTGNLTTAQDALNSILTGAQSAQATMTTWTSESTSSPSTLQITGVNGLQALIATANTTSNGSYVFGGDNTNVAPMNDYTTVTNTVSQAFQSYFGFAPTGNAAAGVTSTQMQSFLDGPNYTSLFSASGWNSTWSNASSTNTNAQVAPGQTIDTSTNANQPGFQQLAQGYALLAVFGGSQLSSAAQQLVASNATSLITQGVNSTTATEASVGGSLSQVSDATTSMSSQMTILQTQIGNLDNVNSTAVATQISTLSTQLQTAYELTAQLQRLSLAQYLPAT
jgi:flagellar hook-associated protein 3 FlgL